MAEGSKRAVMAEQSLFLARTGCTTDRWGAAANALLSVLQIFKVKMGVQMARVVDFS